MLKCRYAKNRPSPEPGQTIELGFLGSVLHVELPSNSDQQQTTETSSFQEKFDPSIHVCIKFSLQLRNEYQVLIFLLQILALMAPIMPSPLCLFSGALSHLWSLWECLILNEPILIFGKSPAMTSQAIWWLLDVIRPVSSVIFLPRYPQFNWTTYITLGTFCWGF